MALKIESVSQLGLTFFGLTSDTVAETRAAIFQQIHQIVFHGKGGYDWKTVYTMPIWLRRFTFNEIQKFYDEEKTQKSRCNVLHFRRNVCSDFSEGGRYIPEAVQQAGVGAW